MQVALLIGAGVAFVAAFALRALRPERAAWAWAAFGAGVLLAGAAFFAPGLLEGDPDVDVAVSIAAPRDGAVVAAGRPVTIEAVLSGAEVATSATDTTGGHLHLYVDGRLRSMPYSTTVKVELKPGPHELTVEFVDLRHVSFDPPVTATVEVEAEKKKG